MRCNYASFIASTRFSLQASTARTAPSHSYSIGTQPSLMTFVVTSGLPATSSTPQDRPPSSYDSLAGKAGSTLSNPPPTGTVSEREDDDYRRGDDPSDKISVSWTGNRGRETSVIVCMTGSDSINGMPSTDITLAPLIRVLGSQHVSYDASGRGASSHAEQSNKLALCTAPVGDSVLHFESANQNSSTLSPLDRHLPTCESSNQQWLRLESSNENLSQSESAIQHSSNFESASQHLPQQISANQDLSQLGLANQRLSPLQSQIRKL